MPNTKILWLSSIAMICFWKWETQMCFNVFGSRHSNVKSNNLSHLSINWDYNCYKPPTLLFWSCSKQVGKKWRLNMDKNQFITNLPFLLALLLTTISQLKVNTYRENNWWLSKTNGHRRSNKLMLAIFQLFVYLRLILPRSNTPNHSNCTSEIYFIAEKWSINCWGSKKKAFKSLRMRNRTKEPWPCFQGKDR
jgi:hypothetical protein